MNKKYVNNSSVVLIITMLFMILRFNFAVTIPTAMAAANKTPTNTPTINPTFTPTITPTPTPAREEGAWYMFDNYTPGSTISTRDTAGNYPDANLVNGASINTGRNSNGLVLDGINDYVKLADDSIKYFTAADGDFTIATWVKLDSTKDYSRIFDFGANTSKYIHLMPKCPDTGKTGVKFAITTGGGWGEQTISTGYDLPVGVWKHIAITWSNNIGIMYIDGVEVGRNTNMTITLDQIGAIYNYIGKSQFTADPYLDGTIDDFLIYYRAFTPSEIKTLTEPVKRINDSDPNIVYSSGWNYSSGRSGSDYMSDIHEFTSPNGDDYFKYTFWGTGINFIAPRYTGNSNAIVYIDGIYQRNVSLSNSTNYISKTISFSELGLSQGTHTMQVYFNNYSWGVLDAIDVFGYTTPTDISLSTTSMQENIAAGSTIATITTSDVDANDVFTYSFASGTGSYDNSSFSIVGNELKINNQPNFEVKNSYLIRLRTTDSGGLYFEKQFIITVSDINENPTPTNTSTPTPSPTNTPTSTPTPASGNITVQLFSANTSASTQWIYPYFRLYNNGTTDVSLSTIKMRYFFTNNFTSSPTPMITPYCDSAIIYNPSSYYNTSNIIENIILMPTKTSTADTYLEVGFSTGTLSAGSYIIVQTRFIRSDLANFTQTDDYSYNGLSSYTDCTNVTAYINGALVWGIEPISHTPTNTPIPLPTNTNTPTNSPTPLPTNTNTPTNSPTPLPTNTNTPTNSPTPSPTNTNTPTPTPYAFYILESNLSAINDNLDVSPTVSPDISPTQISINSFLIGDYVPISIKFIVQTSISNPVIAIDFDIKKIDQSTFETTSSGFTLNEILSSGALDAKSIIIYNNGNKLDPSTYTSSVVTTNESKKLITNINYSFAANDLLKIVCRAKVSAKDYIYDYGLKKYIAENNYNGYSFYILYEISQWQEGGNTITTPYSINTATTIAEKLNLEVPIKIEDPIDLE